MWLLLKDSFFSVVWKQDDPDAYLTVRARRSGDIEKVFGRKGTLMPKSDYRWHARIPREDIKKAMAREIDKITYPNFKSAASDELHGPYMRVWHDLAEVQRPVFGKFIEPRTKPSRVVRLSRATFTARVTSTLA